MDNLQLHSFKQEVIANNKVMFALQNGLWINATEVAKDKNKDLSNYWKSKDTEEYTLALSKFNSVDMTELKVTKQGKYGGTYIHPSLVVHFARWISPDFAVACDEFIKEEITKTSKIREETLIEYHKAQLDKVLIESKRLNDYDGYSTVGRYLKEENLNNYTKDLIYDALTWKGLNKDERVYTTFRRLPENTPMYMGKTILGSTGTPIYPPNVITGVVKEYQLYLDSIEEIEIEEVEGFDN